MSRSRRENWRQIKPLVSVMCIILTLFALVFLHMEERRLGYTVLKLNRENKKIREEIKTKEIQLAKMTRAQHVDNLAQSRFTLKKAQSSQIIHITGNTSFESSTGELSSKKKSNAKEITKKIISEDISKAGRGL